jgi:hypothetical protein
LASALGCPRRRILPSQVNAASLVCKSSSNPLKVVFRVPSREHLFEQSIFLFVVRTTLVVAIIEVYLAVG